MRKECVYYILSRVKLQRAWVRAMEHHRLDFCFLCTLLRWHGSEVAGGFCCRFSMFAGVTNEDRMCLPRGLEGETRSRRSRKRVFMLLLSMGDDSMG